MATSLHPSNAFYHRFTPTSYKHRNLNFYRRFPSSFSGRFRVLTYRGSGHGVCSSSTSSISKASNANNTETEKVAVQQEKENGNERPPFDINLAVALAGFAFEAYTSSPKNVGKWEADAAGCKTVYLSELREIYDGQLFIKLKKGFDFPALDPWVSLASAPVVWCDNISALALASNPIFHARSKHIEVDYHFIREKVANKDILLQHVPTSLQPADIFTKGHTADRFCFLRDKLAITDLPASLWGNDKDKAYVNDKDKAQHAEAAERH